MSTLADVCRVLHISSDAVHINCCFIIIKFIDVAHCLLISYEYSTLLKVNDVCFLYRMPQKTVQMSFAFPSALLSSPPIHCNILNIST